MGERSRGRVLGLKAAVGGLVALGVLGAIFAPSALGASGGTPLSGGVSAAKPSGGPALPGAGSMAVAPRLAVSAAAHWDAAAAARFWTPARLDQATPGGTSAPAKSGSGAAATPSSGGRTPLVATPNMAYSYHFAGVPATGVIFFASNNDPSTHYCTASVVNSAHGNLLVLAAHCNPGNWMAYVPDYQHGLSAAQQPYGIWAVRKVFKDAHFTGTSGAGSDYDYAFAQVAANGQGRQIQSVTGGYALSRTSSYYLYVTALGYPKITADSTDKAIRCSPNVRTGKLPGYRQMVMYCTGFYGGTSGGPWITYFNGRTGYIVGLTGGLYGGGPNSWISYSPMFDDRIFSLFAYAQTH
ncbi:hypothetical protein ABIA32_000038 [Streptacidiphilus sp. MAP12-20]|uniref:trypsin-like serine peptidase n=1 Tax=Streptacidiphilus sp. MAP12-20 TaxID=3156299 RepID=UPI003511E4D3